MSGVEMKGLGQSLVGPGIWAVGFSAVYGLHGLGCARGWPGAEGAAGISLHLLVLNAAWIITMALAAGAFAIIPRAAQGAPLSDRLPRAGAWIGLVATVFTLFPVALISSC